MAVLGVLQPPGLGNEPFLRGWQPTMGREPAEPARGLASVVPLWEEREICSVLVSSWSCTGRHGGLRGTGAGDMVGWAARQHQLHHRQDLESFGTF